MRKIERLLNLLAYLLDSRRPRSVEEIRARVLGYEETGSEEAFRRTFERDKDELRELGVPIEYDEEQGYLIPKDAYYLPELSFPPDEALALSMAVRLAETQPLLPTRNRLHSALLKILFDSEAPSLEARPPLVISLGEGTDELESRLEQLDEAVAARKAVRFLYRGVSDVEPHVRTVEPYGRFYRQGHWYLVGRCRDRKKLRLFRVDRVQDEVQPVSGKAKSRDYEIPASFSIADYASRQLWQLMEEEGSPAVRVRLKVETRLLPLLRPLLAKGTAEGNGLGRNDERVHGWAEVEVEAANREFFLRWLLGLGEGVELLEPPEWRAEIAGLLEKAENALSGRGSR